MFCYTDDIDETPPSLYIDGCHFDLISDEVDYKFEKPYPICTSENIVFDFAIKSGRQVIFDYRYLNKELIYHEDKNFIELGNQKNKTIIRSIDGLRKEFEMLIQYVKEKVKSIKQKIDISDCDVVDKDGNMIDWTEYLINQLIFDILYIKYKNDSPKLTLRQYCKLYNPNMPLYNNELSEEVNNGIVNTEMRRFSDMMKRGIDTQASILNNPFQKKDAEKLGVNAEKYISYFSALNEDYSTNNKKPKSMWDYIYYNSDNKLITSRQYKRNFGIDKENRNYYYKDFIKDFNNYDAFVKKLMENANDNDKAYFDKSMDYYNLEIYKRLDFMYKLAICMENVSIPDVDKNYFLLKLFHPFVVYPFELEGKLKFMQYQKYYRTFLFMEKRFIDINQLIHNENQYRWVLYHLIRAKTYDLFKYHYVFISEDYLDIK